MKITMKGSTMVKPMEETPKGSVWLSSSDLVFPDNFHSRWVNFYRSDGAAAADFFDTVVMKAALSRALVDFYPYAGRLRRRDDGRIEINCNGEGVFFMEAECDVAVDDLGGFSPRHDVSLIPEIDYSKGISSLPLLLIQLTRFKCGGVSLGFANEHHVSDAISALNFVESWSEIACGLTPAVPPSLDRRLLSPRNPPRPQFFHIEHRPPPSLKVKDPLIRSSDMSSSTFRLSRDQINALKQKCKSNNGITYTTYEVVAGHVWHCISVARGLPGDQETKLQVVMDARRRLQPPLPAGFFGNGVFHTAALATCGELGSKPLRFAVEKVKEAIARMDDEYLRSAVDYVELHLPNNAEEGILRSEANCNCPNIAVTSWLRLPFYEADFGWGKPVYSGPGAPPSEGKTFLLVDPQNEGSILLVTTMHKHHINRFHKLLYGDDDDDDDDDNEYLELELLARSKI